MCESLVYGLELDSMLNLLKAYTYVRLYICTYTDIKIPVPFYFLYTYYFSRSLTFHSATI